MDLKTFEAFVESTLLFLSGWGFLLVIVFGILHPPFENPLSLFTLSLSIGLMGIPLGYTIVLISNLIGILLLWVLSRHVDDKTDHYLHRKKGSKKVMDWMKQTPSWKHMVVIGAPLIPTYPIKLALPFSGVSFQRYMKTMIGAYLFLLFGNSLIYFGVASYIATYVPLWVTYLLVIILALYIYFGKYIFKKEQLQ